MRAVVCGSAGELAVEEVADPTPEPDQIVLRVSRCGICGTDLHMHDAGALPAGAIMGHEFCGEVVESRLGWNAGDRVCALPAKSCGSCERCRSGLGAFCETQVNLGLGQVPGAMAEYVAVSAHETVRLPDGVDDDQGALVEPLAVGLHAVNVGRLRRGETCLVIGAGPIGLAVALWARHFGASEVIVSERSPARRAMAEQMGATRVIDPDREALPEVLAAISPGGASVVFEAVGAPGLIREAISHLAFRGRLVVVGLCLQPDPVLPIEAMMKEANLHFVLAYEKDDFQYSVDMLDQERIHPLPMITDQVGFAGVSDAFRTLHDPQKQCKILIDPRR